jgi:hypothetical protein
MAITLRSNANKVTHVKAGVEASFDITTSGTVIAGDHVYVAVAGWQGNFAAGALIANIADNQGGTWVEVFRRRSTGNNHVVALWRGTGVSGGAPLTASLGYDDQGNAGTWSAAIVSAAGMAAAAVHAGNTNENASGTTITTATIATTVADTLVFAFAHAVDNGTNSISTPSGWTLLQENEASEPFSLVYQILSATAGSLSATWTTGGTLVTPISIIAAFEGTSGGGGVGGSPHSQLTLGVGV